MEWIWTEDPPANKMTKKLVHRGPDSIGFYSNFESKIHFGHTRLAILDLKKSGNQPMNSFDDKFYKLFIYRYLSI